MSLFVPFEGSKHTTVSLFFGKKDRHHLLAPPLPASRARGEAAPCEPLGPLPDTPPPAR